MTVVFIYGNYRMRSVSGYEYKGTIRFSISKPRNGRARISGRLACRRGVSLVRTDGGMYLQI